jgi:alpha-glucosidase (family GH31 glycosyl hydrolase)
MPAQSLATVAAIVSFAVHGNRVELNLNQGAAEIHFVTASSFRLRHALTGGLPKAKTVEKQEAGLRAVETVSALQLTTRYLEVVIQKHGLLARVARSDGTPLMTDLTEARPFGHGVAWERAAATADRFLGLGPRTDPAFELRGKVVKPSMPLLISSGGYGELHAAAGAYTFDMAATRPDRYRIEAPGVDYYFFYGPTPKEIYEEAASTRSTISPIPIGDAPATWEGLRDIVRRLAHASMSGVLMPALDMTPWSQAPKPLRDRAVQLGQVTAGVFPEKLALTDLRRRLTTFFATYGEEARDRGFPFFHPLPFQFPEDLEGLRRADQFLLGDELLVAPIYTESNSREVYLPRGVWTNLETNQTHPGRRTITVESQSLPLFGRNGTILPLDAIKPGEPMQLHYFPNLGAEFFLLETDVADWSQAHAAPAVDYMRLEIESKVERLYEWVAHHVEKPVSVEFERKKYTETASKAMLREGRWYYDAKQRNLHVRALARAGDDVIVNLIWPDKP